MMEDILLEPVELTEAELDEVAGGGNECGHGCGCGGISVELELEAKICL
jgi:hypothetical protein